MRAHHELALSGLQVVLSPLFGLVAARIVQLVTKGGKK